MNSEMTSILSISANLVFKIKMLLMHMELMAPICHNLPFFPLELFMIISSQISHFLSVCFFYYQV